MKTFVRRTLLSVLALGMAAGCATHGQVAETIPLQDLGAPKWVLKGSGAFADDQGRTFQGVCSAYGMRDYALLRTTAEDRARKEVARLVHLFTATLMKDYREATHAGDPDAGPVSDEQRVEQAMQTVTAMTLSGVEVVDHWQHPRTGEFFSLARVDLTGFEDSLDQARELDSRVRAYMHQNAERLHEDLVKGAEMRQGTP